MTEAIWTLDELTERVGAALSVGYDGQPSGRVRHLPDQRAIRWYTTIGLVDRPAATRGRTAMYGPRHLLQLVAIKRLQAQGLSLVAIQAELAGATDTQLARVAQVPQAAAAPGAAAPDAPPAAPTPPFRRPTAALRATPAVARPFAEGDAPPAAPEAGQAVAPAPPAPPGKGEAVAPAPPAAPAAGQGGTPATLPTLAAGRSPARPARFWRERPAEAMGPAGPGAVDEAVGTPTRSGSAPEAQPGGNVGTRSGAGVGGVVTLQGVRLGQGATLLLEPGRPLDDADLRAILDAARPLLRALRARGLDHPRRELP
jgi:MerR HTH family regulatory protein